MDLADALIDRDLGDAELSAALAECLAVSPADILIVDDLETAEIAANVRLIGHRIPARGDFVLLLSFYPRTDELRKADGGRIVAFLSQKFQCRCLVSDGEVNPHSMLMFDHGKGPQPVLLESEGMAKDPEEYRLRRG